MGLFIVCQHIIIVITHVDFVASFKSEIKRGVSPTKCIFWLKKPYLKPQNACKSRNTTAKEM